MQQSANVEKEHNGLGMPPSDFKDIKDASLRDRNRGAILANTFERYVDEKTNTLLPRDLALCTRAIDQYMGRIPKKEQRAAREAMIIHLAKRGFTINE